MKRAPEALLKVGVLASTRDQLREIAMRTRERLWLILARLVEAEYRRVVHSDGVE